MLSRVFVFTFSGQHGDARHREGQFVLDGTFAFIEGRPYVYRSATSMTSSSTNW